jgi:hypothetical protein
MDPSRFDTLARSLTEVRSRRGALSTLLGGALGLLGLADTAAKKGKGSGKGKKKKKNGESPPTPPVPPPPQGPSCAATCSNNCKFCLFRATGPTLCGDSYSYGACGTPVFCSSDNDCIEDPAKPYCITGGEDRATGTRFPSCLDGKGQCSSITAC